MISIWDQAFSKEIWTVLPGSFNFCAALGTGGYQYYNDKDAQGVNIQPHGQHTTIQVSCMLWFYPP